MSKRNFVKERGQALKRFRKMKYATAKVAVDYFISVGCSIDYQRYLDLERGAYPKDDREVRQVCTMLGISEADWLYGHDPDIPDVTDELRQILEDSGPRMREVMKDMVKAGVLSAKNQGLE